MTAGLLASDPVDEIYSLLALSGGGEASERLVEPDYRASLRQCIENAVRYVICREDFFVLASYMFDLDQSGDNALEPWPSWIRCSIQNQAIRCW